MQEAKKKNNVKGLCSSRAEELLLNYNELQNMQKQHLCVLDCFPETVYIAVGQFMDQKVTVYTQLGVMNGNVSDGGEMIALSKQLHTEYK